MAENRADFNIILLTDTLQYGRTYTSSDFDVIKSGSVTVSENGLILYFDNLVIECLQTRDEGILFSRTYRGDAKEKLSIELTGENYLQTNGLSVIDLYRTDLTISGSGSLTTRSGDSYFDICLGYWESLYNGQLVIDNTTVSCQGGGSVSCCQNVIVKNSRFEGTRLSIDNLTLERCAIRFPVNGYSYYDEGYRVVKIYDEFDNISGYFVITTPEDDNIPSTITFLGQALLNNHTYTSADYSEIKSGCIFISENGREMTLDNLVIDDQTSQTETTELFGRFYSSLPLSIVLKGECNVKTNKDNVVHSEYQDVTIIGDGSLTTRSSLCDFLINGNVLIENTTLNCEGDVAMCGSNILVRNSRFEGNSLENISMKLEGCSVVMPYNGRVESEYGCSYIVDESGDQVSHFIITTPEDDNSPSAITFLGQTLMRGHTYTSADFSEIDSGSFSVSDNSLELTLDHLIIDDQSGMDNVFESVAEQLSIVLKGECSVKTTGSHVVEALRSGKMTISGDGSLTTQSSQCDFSVLGCDVVIDNTTLDCEGPNSIVKDFWADEVTSIFVNNSRFEGNYLYVNRLTMEGCSVVRPINGRVVSEPFFSYIADESGNPASHFIITTPEDDNLPPIPPVPCKIDFLGQRLNNNLTYTSDDFSEILSGSFSVSEDGFELTFDHLIIDDQSGADNIFYTGAEQFSIVLNGECSVKTTGSYFVKAWQCREMTITGNGSLTTQSSYNDFAIHGCNVVIDNTTLNCLGDYAIGNDFWYEDAKILVRNSRFEGNNLIGINSLTMEGCSIIVPYHGFFAGMIFDESGNLASHFIITTPEDDNIPPEDDNIPSWITFLNQVLICNRTYTSADFSEIDSGSFSVSENGRELTFDNLSIDVKSEKEIFKGYAPFSIILKGENSVKTTGSVVVDAHNCGNLTITGDGSLTTRSDWYDFWINNCNVLIDNTTLDCGGVAMGDNTELRANVIVNHSTFKGGTFISVASLTLINSAFVSPEDAVFIPVDDWDSQLFTSDGQRIYSFEIGPVEGDFHQRVSPKDFANIIIAKGETKEVSFRMKNDGIEEIREIAYVLSVDGVETQEKTFSLPEPYTQTGGVFTATIPIEAGYEVGNHELTLMVTKVNGLTNTSPRNTGKGILCVITREPSKRVVIEEFTATWCSWCPRGTLALELLNNEYGDSIISIVSHQNDPMYTESYIGSSLYPAARVNRGDVIDPYYGYSGAPYGIRDVVEEERNVNAPAEFVMSATWGAEDESAIWVNTKTTFMVNDDASNYGIGFVLLEDGMTGSGDDWAQTNSYAGAPTDNDPLLQPITELPSIITDIEYNHVVVDAWGIVDGVKGSVKDIQVNVAQQFSYLCDISSNKLIQDKSKLSVVALLFDKRTGKICNAAKTTDIREFDPSAIPELKVDDSKDSPAIYHISGRKVNPSTLPKGVYIKNGQKIVVK